MENSQHARFSNPQSAFPAIPINKALSFVSSNSSLNEVVNNHKLPDTNAENPMDTLSVLCFVQISVHMSLPDATYHHTKLETCLLLNTPIHQFQLAMHDVIC